jgi:Predicted NTPase (NACHT family)
MGKLILFKIGEGDINQGFPVLLQMGDDGAPPETDKKGILPPLSQIMPPLEEWQTNFRDLADSRGINPQPATKNASFYRQKADDVTTAINNWLNSDFPKWKKIREALQRYLDVNDVIRVIIQTENPQLRQVPWHLWDLFKKDYPHTEIAVSAPEYEPPQGRKTPPKGKVRILAIFGQSPDKNIPKEIKTQNDWEAINSLPYTEIKRLDEPTPEELRQWLWDDLGWHILFFAGHSESDTLRETGWIQINPQQSITISELKNALKTAIENGLQLAIFNSCDGLGLAKQLEDLHIPQVIVMREKVPDKVAQQFLRHFLTAFAGNRPLYSAVREARLRLEDDCETQYPGVSWLPIISQHPAVQPPTYRGLRTGEKIAGSNLNNATGMKREEYRNRQALLNKVRNFWIKGVLEKSLYNKAKIELGLEEHFDAVELAWATPEATKQDLPVGIRAIDKFDELGIGKTLLILGEPGAGKTTTLLEITADLIADAEEDVNKPIPIVFNLSSWTNQKQSIANWLVEQLHIYYQVPKSLGQTYVSQQELLLFLDGLDEVKADIRDLCVQAINQFIQDYGQTEIIVCSRIKDYHNLSRNLRFQGAIFIKPLTDEQVESYLNQAGNKLLGVKTALKTDSVLQELVKTPLILSIMSLAYEGMSAEELPKMPLDERRKHLFDKYIDRMFTQRYQDVRRYQIKETRKKWQKQKHTAISWLSFLSKKMNEQSKTIFFIEEIHSNWINTKNKIQKNIYRLFFMLVHGQLLSWLIFFNLLISDVINPLVTDQWFINFSQGMGNFMVILSLIFSFDIGIERSFQTKFNYKKGIIGTIENLSNCLYAIGFFGIIGLLRFLSTGKIIFLIEGLVTGINVTLFLAIFDFSLSGLSKKKIEINIERYEDNFYKTFKILGKLVILIDKIFNWIIKVINPKQKIERNNKLEQTAKTKNKNSKHFGIIAKFYISSIAEMLYFIRRMVINNNIDDDDENLQFPNQGIRKAIFNSFLYYLVINLSLFVWFSLSFYIFWGKTAISFALVSSQLIGDYIFVCSISYCLEHFEVRLILYLSKVMPWNYARFLDWASERLFLQKVGGAYIFIHRMLQEHFANMKSN